MKIKSVCTFLFFVSLHFSLSAQDINDSLQAVLAKSQPDSNKVNTLIALSKSYLSTDPNKAILYASQARDLSLRLNFLYGEAYSYKNLGLVYVMQGKYVDALENYEKALQIFDSLDDKSGQANILSNQGNVYFNKADDSKALELYLRGLQVAEQTTDSTRIATLLLNIGALYAHKEATYDKALDYYFRALKISKSLPDKNIIATVNSNIGEIYLFRNDSKLALQYLNQSLIDYNNSENTPYALNLLGRAYRQKGDHNTAIKFHRDAYDFAKKLDAPIDVAQSLLGLGDTYSKKLDWSSAIEKYREAESIAVTISNANDEIKLAYMGLAVGYANQKDFTKAYQYQVAYTQVKDTLYNIESGRKLNSLQFTFDIQKKEAEVDLLTKDKVVQDLLLRKQKAQKNILLGGLAFVFIIIGILYRNYRSKIRINKILDRQNAEIESLILNVLPAEVAQELQKTGVATPRFYEQASVLFTDFKSFSSLADNMSPQEVVTELNDCFVAFDNIIDKYSLEKIKTIGDSYMCAGGIPTADEAHFINIIKASLEIQEFIKTRNALRNEINLPPWDIRIGINTGPLVAGVVGKKKYAYDIWGGTVNVASRMESNGEPGRVNISAATYERIKNKYACTYRGKIFAKNIGEIDMYFVDKELN